MSTTTLATSRQHFVLVHGSGHGAWCWYKVRPVLESLGHTVTCIDLKGSGDDPSDPKSVLSFEDYNKPLVDLLSSPSLHQKVILVGHSAGGISVSRTIHKFPEKIRVAVFIAGIMLNLGFQTPQDLKDGGPDLTGMEDKIEYEFGKGVDQPPTTAFLKPEFQRNHFYHLSPLEDCTLAEMRIRPCPMAPIGAKWEENKESNRVPRVYIKTSQDKALKPEQQDAMIKKWPPSQVYTIDTDHSPFFSTPSLLCDLLANIALSF
ncbi:hypothetical protein RND81_01G165600 [Saponaria officinalis]|uniref:AB hydrolase-1 domain-containing protein n=1 Tax=Saponaria officinalis TaxID=3572 RepID=A0AAW1NJ85_SAPOF